MIGENTCAAPAGDAFGAAHMAVLARLQAAGIALPRNPRAAGRALHERLDASFGAGFEAVLGAGVLRGVRLRAGREVTLTGLIEGAPLDAAAAWMIAESVLTSVRARPDRPIVILYDSVRPDRLPSGRPPASADDVAHLAAALRWASARGVAVSLWLCGPISAAVHAGLRDAVQRAIALPGAEIEPPPGPGVSPRADATWLRHGLVDDVLDGDALPAAVAAAAGLPGA